VLRNNFGERRRVERDIDKDDILFETLE